MKMIIASGLAAIMVMSALVYNASTDKIEAKAEPQIVEQKIEIEMPPVKMSRELPVTYIDMTPVVVNELTNAEPPRTVKFNLSDDWRLYIECMVAGEVGGEPYDAMLAVAQCIYNAMLKHDYTPEEVRINYQYVGWKSMDVLAAESTDAADNVRRAVSQIFDDEDFITNEPILYFYAPAYGRSDWHEAQEYWDTISNSKFFYLKDDIEKDWYKELNK